MSRRANAAPAWPHAWALPVRPHTLVAMGICCAKDLHQNAMNRAKPLGDFFEDNGLTSCVKCTAPGMHTMRDKISRGCAVLAC